MISIQDRKQITIDIFELLKNSVAKEYANAILSQMDTITGKSFVNSVIDDIVESSEFSQTRRYNDDDIRLAIGRELVARLGCEM